MTLAIMHASTYPKFAELMPLLDDIYERWKGCVADLKPSEYRNVMHRKIERYERVLATNRLI